MYENHYDTASELMHYGVLGMKWGVRRAQKYQSEDRITQLNGKIKKYSDKSAKYREKGLKRIYRGRDTYFNNLRDFGNLNKWRRKTGTRKLYKSVKYEKKAKHISVKLEKEAAFVDAMKRKVSSIPKEELDSGYAFVKDFLKNSQ